MIAAMIICAAISQPDPVVAFVQEVKLATLCTDHNGYPFGSWGDENYADTLWIITEGHKTRVKPPFGQYAYYDHNDGVQEIGQAA